MAREKVWFNIYLEKEKEEDELLSKVKSKGLAYKVKYLFEGIYGKKIYIK